MRKFPMTAFAARHPIESGATQIGGQLSNLAWHETTLLAGQCFGQPNLKIRSALAMPTTGAPTGCRLESRLNQRCRNDDAGG